MSPNPYENEPGFENSDDVRMQADYVAKVSLIKSLGREQILIRRQDSARDLTNCCDSTIRRVS